MSSIPRILKDLRTWDARNNALISAGISDTLDIIAHFNRVRSSFTRHPSDRIMESFAKAWNVISSALCQRNAILTPTATLEHTQQYLKLQDLPPSTKLVALCLLIGFSNPSVPAEHTLKNSGELRTALFALSITVLAEDDIFGKQTALSVQQALLSTISNSDLEQVKTQVVSMLDKPTELSASSVDVISKYVAVFPVVIVSELLERLRPTSGSLLAPNDLASVTRTRNAVRVVESLAEGDFFVLVLSEEGHERRVNLENTVVELLQDKDIMIRMTASQIVAMLDPTKIISKFAPELTSSKGEVRSTAELVLLECMLFQKRDGSLGDGFVALLDYMRAEAIVALSDRMVEVMEHQGPLTEDVVKDAVETNDEAFDDLQVARASPLLILKTIPAYGFARQFKTMESSSTEAGSESIPAKMTRLLKSENHLETRYARALSLAVLQGMFPSSSLETIHANLAKQLTRISDEPEQRDFEACRTWLFALHTWVMNWTTQWNTPEQTGGDVAWIYRIINDFFYRFVSIGAVKKELEQDVYKLQLAVVEILSKILLFTAPFYTKSQKNPFSKKLDGLCSKHPFSVTATIEEIPDDDSVDLRNDNDSSVTPKSLEDLFLALLGDILSFVTQPLRDCDDTSVPYAICLANVFIMTMQTFAPSSERKPDAAVRISTRDASDSSRVVPSRWIPCILMDLITPCLASSLTTLLTDPEFSPNQRYTALIQTCIQILYVGAGIAGAVEERTTSRTTNHCAMGVAVSGIESSEFAIAVGSLKLLAYMTQTKMITSDLLTDANVVAIRKGLTRLQQSKQMEANTGSEITYLLDAMWEVVA
ncbi:hypothetical protein BGX28_007531 [Mortierella sp. GBA30]|nr:hypothetical protein BGX28_007531 [Mortierella sp. GBA30]